MRPLILAGLLAALMPSVSAQTAGQGISSHRAAHSPPVVFYSSLYSDALYREGPPPTSQSPVIVLQTAPPAAPTPERSPVPVQPLMIELQGGRYVRISGEETSTAEMQQLDGTTPMRTPASRRSAKARAIAARPATQLIPAILVFRDGHCQEVSEYTIAGGILYAQADYYADGSWNKKIELSSLNLQDTVVANQSRGIKFQLPTAANEVIVRP